MLSAEIEDRIHRIIAMLATREHLAQPQAWKRTHDPVKKAAFMRANRAKHRAKRLANEVKDAA